MSGIAGVVNRTGAPLDREILVAFQESLAFRGPQGGGLWHRDGAGLVQTLLDVAGLNEAQLDSSGRGPSARQPCSLDGHVWIAADARIDARTQLVEALKAKGRVVSNAARDAELILHAYHAWGTDCPRRLLGDFAFAIFDTVQQRLFCARDQLGIKPFFYACNKDFLAFSNTLDCLRLHAGVTNRLDEQSLADFLLFGFRLDASATAFAEIRRLPPGHFLVSDAEGTRIQPYWSPAVPQELSLRCEQDYIDQFLEIFAAAVSDRSRARRLGLYLSGGLDSSAVASVLQDRGGSSLRAATFVYDQLIPDGERAYAAQVSTALAIPHDFFVVDDVAPFDNFWDCESAHAPEPGLRAFSAFRRETAKACLSHAHLFLTGAGADEGLRPPGDYFLCLLRELRLGRWGIDVLRHLVAHKKLPHHRVRTTLRQALAGRSGERVFPQWLNPDLVARLDLETRWRDFWEAYQVPRSTIPGSMTNLTSGVLARYFEWYDPGTTGFPLQRCSPFADLRVLEYLLSVPTVPWKFDKYLLRRAMRRRLPQIVLNRRKTPLPGDPILSYVRRHGFGLPVDWSECLARTPELESYRTQPVDTSRARTNFDSGSVHGDIRCFELASWLYHRQPRPASRCCPVAGTAT